MALLLKESSDLISAYQQQHYRSHSHPAPPSFHHPLSSNNSMVHPTPKYPLDLRTSIIESSYDAQESAARILFSAINWAKTVPAFVSLSTRDQVRLKQKRKPFPFCFHFSIFFFVAFQLTLLEEAWRDLFIITAAEQKFTHHLADLLNKTGKWKTIERQT